MTKQEECATVCHVGGVDKDVPEKEWRKIHTNRALREGRELYNWKYVSDPDPTVFQRGEARISYLTKPLEGGRQDG